MPRLIHHAICERVIVDNALNSVSMIDVLEELTPPILPVGYPEQIVFFCLWVRDDNVEGEQPFTWRVVLRSDNDQVLAERSLTIPRLRLRSMFNLVGLPLTRVGTMRIQNQWKLPDELPEAYRDAGEPFEVIVNQPLTPDQLRQFLQQQ